MTDKTHHFLMHVPDMQDTLLLDACANDRQNTLLKDTCTNDVKETPLHDACIVYV